MALLSGSMLAEDTFTMDRFNELRNDTLGMPGTPIDVSGVRTIGGTYQNTINQARWVSFSAKSTDILTITGADLSKDSTTWKRIFTAEGGQVAGDYAHPSFSFPVPKTWYYRIKVYAAGTPTVNTWMEFEN